MSVDARQVGRPLQRTKAAVWPPFASGRVGRLLVDADGVSLDPRPREEVRKPLHLVWASLSMCRRTPWRSASCDPVKVTGAVIPVLESSRREPRGEVERARRSRMSVVPGIVMTPGARRAPGCAAVLQARRSHDHGLGVYKMDRQGGRRCTGGRTDRSRMSTSTDHDRHEHCRTCRTEAVHLHRSSSSRNAAEPGPRRRSCQLRSSPTIAHGPAALPRSFESIPARGDWVRTCATQAEADRRARRQHDHM